MAIDPDVQVLIDQLNADIAALEARLDAVEVANTFDMVGTITGTLTPATD